MEACNTFKGLIRVKQIKSRRGSFVKDRSLSNTNGCYQTELQSHAWYSCLLKQEADGNISATSEDIRLLVPSSRKAK